MKYPASMSSGVSQHTALEEILSNIAYLFALLLLGKLLSWLWRLRSKYWTSSNKKKASSVAPKAGIANGTTAARAVPCPVVAQSSRSVVAPAVTGASPRQPMQDILVDTPKRPSHSRRILSREEFCDRVRVGEHYAVRRYLLGICVFHHFLVTEVSQEHVKVIHYNGTAQRYIKSAKKIFGEVVEETISKRDCDLLDIPGNLFVVDDPLYVAAADGSGGVAAVVRARQRLGEARYGMTYNNCEHFVRWALTGQPRCVQYDRGTVSDKIVGSLVDELPHFGFHLTFKVLRDACYGITSAVETFVLEGGARLMRHTAEASLPAVASTAAATAGLAAPAEAAYLAYRIVDMKRRLADGTLSRRDYDNAKDKAITSAVLSLACSTCGAVLGQLVVPLPLLGAVLGSFWGGVLGRLWGASVAAFGIAIKEKYWCHSDGEERKDSTSDGALNLPRDSNVFVTQAAVRLRTRLPEKTPS